MECKERALKYVEIRLRSEFEMRSYLRKKGCQKEEIDDTVAFLYEYGYLNEREFCRAFVRDKINFNPCGRNKIFADLRRKGVKSEDIKAVFAEILDKETELEMARRLLKKQNRLEAGPLKQAQFLQGKGFSHGVISSLINFYDENG